MCASASCAVRFGLPATDSEKGFEMEFDDRKRLARMSDRGIADSAFAPGKRTLTEQLPVQRQGAELPRARESTIAAPARRPDAEARASLHALFNVQRAPWRRSSSP
jgi:hypothetical protein